MPPDSIDKPVTRAIGVVVRPGREAWIALAILCGVYALNFLDWQLLSILAKPIQDDIGVTDGQLGRISGFYFALFYCVIALPVGWLADRSNRVRVLAFACALWSAAPMACGFTSTYRQLVLAHGGRGRRGGWRAALVCNLVGLLPFGPARPGNGSV